MGSTRSLFAALRRRSATGVATLVTAALLLPATPAMAAWPPDQIDPPIPGEGQPLDDPSDPAPGYSAFAQPRASLRLSGPRWRPIRLRQTGGPNRYHAAVDASRSGWRAGSRAVVLVAGNRPFDALSAAGLAGTVNGPLLYTEAGRLTGVTGAEIARLDPRRAYLVGGLSLRVARQVRRLGVAVERLGGANRYTTSMAVARRAIALGAAPRTVLVASGQSYFDSAGVTALAAGGGLPVLLARPRWRGSSLRDWTDQLGTRRVIAVGSSRWLPAALFSRALRVRRVRGAGGADTAVAAAAYAGRLRLTGSPVLVAAGDAAAAGAGGVLAGIKRRAPLLVSGRKAVSVATGRWLSRTRPRRITVLRGGPALPALSSCQLRHGALRSWDCAERMLKRQGYVVPQADGRIDRSSVWAIYAFEKVAGRRPDGVFGNAEWRRMLDNPRMRVRRKDLPSTHVEINIGRQLILLVSNGKVAHHIHTSTGKASTPTIRGTFSVYEMRSWRQSNGIYKGIFFHRGYAIHGYPKIPLYPASHGCARVYDGNQDFLWPKVFVGERVATY